MSAQSAKGARIGREAWKLTWMGWLIATACGCTSTVSTEQIRMAASESRARLQQLLLSSDNPVVRAQAIEAIQEVPWPEAPRYIQHALTDAHRGVRFAACMALGQLRHAESKQMLAAALKDSSPSVRAAAIFALHRLGDTTHTTELARFLLYTEDVEVRRNAAMILGELGEPGARSVLRRALRDKDDAVRWYTLEAMARLGDSDAMDRLMLFAHSAYSDERLIGILALGRVKDRKVIPALQEMIRRDNPLEVKLAAIRAIGQHGIRQGADIARKALTWSPRRSKRPLAPEPPEVQIVRVRSMAAMALAEVGGPEVIPDLVKRMRQDDPRVQVAAAKAILRIADRAGIGPSEKAKAPAG